MGIWNFYIDVKCCPEFIDFLEKEYRNNSFYQRCFHFSRLPDGWSQDYSGGISSVIDNFLPANHLIYNFLSSHEYEKNFYIKSNGTERVFDFDFKYFSKYRC